MSNPTNAAVYTKENTAGYAVRLKDKRGTLADANPHRHDWQLQAMMLVCFVFR